MCADCRQDEQIDRRPAAITTTLAIAFSLVGIWFVVLLIETAGR